MQRDARSRSFWLLLALGGAVTALGLGAAHFMESRGHVVTGMTNQVVWGLPRVFAIFMIVAASGVLNVASIASAFGQALKIFVRKLQVQKVKQLLLRSKLIFS